MKFGPVGPPQHLTQKLNDLVKPKAHTPGPNRGMDAHLPDGPWVAAPAVHGNDGVYLLRDSKGRAFAELAAMTSVLRRHDEIACLIATAPEMLEALETAEDRLLTLFDAEEGTHKDRVALRKVQAAIQKARGGQ
jgi:hypothetical protein